MKFIKKFPLLSVTLVVVLAFVGLGLWGVRGRPEEDPRNALALLAIAPVGADWSAFSDHALGASININEGLWVRRSDPPSIQAKAPLVPVDSRCPIMPLGLTRIAFTSQAIPRAGTSWPCSQ